MPFIAASNKGKPEQTEDEIKRLGVYHGILRREIQRYRRDKNKGI